MADHVFKFYLNVWKFAKGDLKLNCARLSIQYRNFEKRREFMSLLEPRPQKNSNLYFATFAFETPENLFDFQVEYDMNKYANLRNEFNPANVINGNNNNEISDGNNLNSGVLKQHRGGIALTGFNPATTKTQLILTELAEIKQYKYFELEFFFLNVYFIIENPVKETS